MRLGRTSAPRPFGSAWRSSRARLGALLLLGAGCDFPEPEACVLACGPAGECPSAFECQPETWLCAPPGMSEPCTSTVALPGGPSEAPPDAGEPAVPPGGGPSPSESPDAGETPGEPPPAEALAVDRAEAPTACTGTELSLELSASGGEAPYAWQVIQAPAGLRLSGAAGALVRLVGVPEAPGVVLVALEDGAGRRAMSEPLRVYERPVIATSSLPALCSGASYRVELEASGGEPGAYVWSARVTSGADAPSLEELGLDVVGSSLSAGPLPEGDALGLVHVELGLRDAQCAAEAVELELEVATLESDVCPSITIVSGPDADGLPPPCRGSRYAEALTVEGGEPPFTWTELTSPPGLFFDVDSAVIEGIAEEDGELAVAVTDAGGRTVEARYDVRLRDQCWLAYVAGGVAPARLTFVDARLLSRQPATARRVLPLGATAEAVSDFRFSPDGRFLAYRLGLAPDALRVELVRMSDGATGPLDLPGSVAEYAWSNDSSILFVATGVEQRVLHGVDVSNVRGAGDAGLVGARLLAARAIPIPSGPFAPLAARELAFLAADAVSQRLRLVTSGVERASVAAPIVRSELDFSIAAHVSGASAGAVVADPGTGLTTFFPGGGRPPATRGDVLLSGSGALAARASGGSLSLFDSASAELAPALFEIAGCARLLAGSSERDRWVCFSDRPARAALAFFELGEGGLVERAAPSDLAAGLAGDPLGVRRALSRRGRWFAIPDAAGLAVWSFDPGTPRLGARVAGVELGAPVSTLAFSPDEDRLLVGMGNRLALLELGAPGASLVELSPSALLEDTCSERSVDGLEQWCGSDAGLAAARWSGGSDVVAFRSSLGTLTVIDVSGAREGRIGAPLGPDSACDEACLSGVTARFQP